MTSESYRESSRKKLEPMADFFTARIDGYEAHMTKDGDVECYRKLAELVPSDAPKILDIGCGTGLELDWIFQRLPSISVTGIDLAQAMLDKLKQKHPDKDLTLICGDYFKVSFSNKFYDAVISCNTLHHFSREQKLVLYRNILKALKPGGLYIEGDYMVDDQVQEDELYAENARVRREQNILDGAFYHFDTPCTTATQAKLLKQAGFSAVQLVFRLRNFGLISALK